MQLMTKDGDNLMTVEKIEREGNTLVVHGEIMNALPVRAVLTPSEARNAFKLLDFKTIVFAASMLFRRDKAR